jgi:sulfur dioxygenase
MIFRQLFDPETSTYSYLLADPVTREAVLIDAVLEQRERDIKLMEELDLTLKFAVETHVHADHVTASGLLRERLGCQIGVGEAAEVPGADLHLKDGDQLQFGALHLEVLVTPGHTNGCVTYLCRDAGMVFTGDALLIRGCGRTDFQEGDATMLFSSIREKIFSLPDDVTVYPGHDYQGRTVSSVDEEKRFNPRMGLIKSVDEFVELMSGLNLAYPKKMDIAVPANLLCGLSVPGDSSLSAGEPSRTVAGVMEESGRQDAEIWMGVGI